LEEGYWLALLQQGEHAIGADPLPAKALFWQDLNVDRQQRRIGLSLKRLQPDPWSSVEESYVEGQLVQGVITNVVSFGAFVRVEEGLEGLIHVSELAGGGFVHPRSVVKEGDTVTVRIVNIDSANHRLGLSLRQVFGEKDLSRGEDVLPG